MKAVAAKQGTIIIDQVPEPELLPGHVRIRTEFSAISPGTELGILKRSGETPAYLGYSAVGIVEEAADGVAGFAAGQRVAVYGAPYVRHAEVLAVPANLCAAVPDGVRPQDAAFAGLGAIAIHSLRIADLRFGESAVVVGLGILGQITAQIAAAAAYRTAGCDMNAERAAFLQQSGVGHAYADPQELEAQLGAITGGPGADAVILCASGSGEKLINDALRWIRDRGKVVIVGDLTAEFSRAQMFGKEAQVLISRAGGPGRYDTGYERDNRDYPIGYVRWTEGRNTAEYIRLLAEGRIRLDALPMETIPLSDAADAYARYAAPSTTMGTLFAYGG